MAAALAFGARPINRTALCNSNHLVVIERPPRAAATVRTAFGGFCDERVARRSAVALHRSSRAARSSSDAAARIVGSS
jgi:hypothetical protein